MKQFISAAVLLLSSINLYAQDSLSQKNVSHKIALDFGISSSSDVSYDLNYNDKKRIYAPTAGLNYLFQFSGIHGFTTGINYYQIGDNYYYYTGFNAQRTDTKIYVHTVKIPLLYTATFKEGNLSNVFLKVGPSIDYILKDPVIAPEAPLNNPIGFRKNIGQGSIENRVFTPINFAIGVISSNFNGFDSYLELSYTTAINNIYPKGKNAVSTSSFDNIALKYGVLLNKSK